jgi:phage/plasmid-like protein (TIGR03299 family)
MGAETSEWYNTQTLIGFTEKRGNAWHYRESVQGEVSNHYPGAIPVDDVLRRLFSWSAIDVDIEGVVETIDAGGNPVQIRYPDSRRKGIVRSDTGEMFGIFKQSYHAHDPKQWLLGHLQKMLPGQDLAIGNAGLLRGGAQHWVQVEMEDTLVACDLEFRPFLTAMGSMDGSLATTYQDGVQIVVCDNTMADALSEDAQRVKIYHGVNAEKQFEEQVQAIDIVRQVGERFRRSVEEKAAQKVSWQRFGRWADAFAGLDAEKPTKLQQDRVAQLHNLWSTDERTAPWKGTALGVVQVANTWTQHFKPVSGASRFTRNTERLLQGKVGEADQRALQLLASV